MFCGPVCCHFRFATCQIPTIRWYEAIIFMLCNIITAQTPLVIENSGINLILLLKRSEKKKKISIVSVPANYSQHKMDIAKYLFRYFSSLNRSSIKYDSTNANNLYGEGS